MTKNKGRDSIRKAFYACIPVFLLFSLYSQMQCVKVIDMHNAIESVSPIKKTSENISAISTSMTFIPAIEPYIEVSSVISLFNNMKIITDKYSDNNAIEIFNEMENQYIKELNSEDSFLYLFSYQTIVKDMINYFKNYCTFGADPEVTTSKKSSLSINIKILQTMLFIKMILYVVLFVCALVGIFIYKGRYSEKLMD